MFLEQEIETLEQEIKQNKTNDDQIPFGVFSTFRILWVKSANVSC